MSLHSSGVDPTSVGHNDPEERLRALFDRGTARPLTARDDSGVLPARGGGAPVIAFATVGAAPGAREERALTGTARAVELGLVDEIVRPENTRRRIAETLAATPAGRGNHTNLFGTSHTSRQTIPVPNYDATPSPLAAEPRPPG